MTRIKADTRQQAPRVGPEDNSNGERYERERTRDTSMQDNEGTKQNSEGTKENIENETESTRTNESAKNGVDVDFEGETM